MERPEHIKDLLTPSAYPHEVANISLLETHISWVILTGRYAYKIKKPVDLGFLDFSTRKLRHHYCQRELELNRRFAPALYLAVLPIVRTRAGHRVEGTGEIVDYCLKMREFGPDQLLSQRLAQHAFDGYWMDMLAHDLACFHEQAQAFPNIAADEQLARHMRDNLDVARTHIPQAIDPQQYARLRQDWHDAFEQRHRQLRARQQRGRIRDGHGDLHLRNIALIDGRPTPFDCIEFSDELRRIDVLNDIAFLVMDCDAEQRPDLGFRFLSRYLEHSGDYAGLATLPLYLCYRAGVRGKVACILADEQPEAAQDWQTARTYFALAGRYLRATRPRLFAIGGLSGSGKSHLALLGCGAERAIVIRSDGIRMRLSAGLTTQQRYSEAMHVRTYEAMFEAAREALAAGFSVILDATFLHEHSQTQLRALANEAGVPLHAYWLNLDVDTLRANIQARRRQGQDISEADLRVLEQQLREHRPPPTSEWQYLASAAQWPRAASKG